MFLQNIMDTFFYIILFYFFQRKQPIFKRQTENHHTRCVKVNVETTIYIISESEYNE